MVRKAFRKWYAAFHRVLGNVVLESVALLLLSDLGYLAFLLQLLKCSRITVAETYFDQIHLAIKVIVDTAGSHLIALVGLNFVTIRAISPYQKTALIVISAILLIDYRWFEENEVLCIAWNHRMESIVTISQRRGHSN